MNTDTGRIRELQDGERAMPNEVLLSQIEADYLKVKEAHERPATYKALHSHNNSKKRRERAKLEKHRKKIANASKAKNRR